MSGIALSTIILSTSWAFVQKSATAVWSAIFFIVTALISLFSLVFTTKGIIFLTVFSVWYGAGFGIMQFQEPFMQGADTFWECGLRPVTEVSFSITYTLVRGGYEYFSHGWNQGVDFIYGFVNDFISDVNALGSPTTVNFYVGLVDAIYQLNKATVFWYRNVPAWQIPFGISDFFNSFIVVTWCLLFDTQEVMGVNFLNNTLIGSNCLICDMDPAATCFLRQQLIPAFPAQVGPTCVGCNTAPCVFIRCGFDFLDQVTEVIQVNIGFDLSPYFADLADAACCTLQSTFLPPLYIGIGLVENLISGGSSCSFAALANIPDLIATQWLGRIFFCIIRFARILTFGLVDDLWVLIFSVFFPFVQAVIDTFNTMVDCSGRPEFVGCLSSYPSNCAFTGGDPFADAGLQTCFNFWGSCIVNGVQDVNGTFVIDGAPLFAVQPFVSLFTTVIPLFFQILDTVVCNLFAAIPCFTPSNIGGTCPIQDINFNNFLTIIICVTNCVKNSSPAFFFVADIFDKVTDIFFNTFQDIYDFINDVGDVINDICDNVPFCLSKQSNGKNLVLKLSWYETLSMYNVTNNTFCGNLLWTLPPKNVTYDNWGEYMAASSCFYLYAMGVKWFSKHDSENNTIVMDDFLSPLTIYDNFDTMFRSHRNTTNYNNNTVPYSLKQSLDFRSENRQKQYNFTNELKESLFMKNLVKTSKGIMDNLQKSPYYKITMGFMRDQTAVSNEIIKRGGTIPEYDSKMLIKRYNKIKQQEENNTYLIEKKNANDFLREYYQGINNVESYNSDPWKRANDLHTLYAIREELNLRYVSAMNDVFKRERKSIPWWARANAGEKGRLIIEEEERAEEGNNIEYEEYSLENDTRLSLNPRKEYDNDIYKYTYSYKIYTRDELDRRREQLRPHVNTALDAADSSKKIIDVFNHDGGFVQRAIKHYNVDHWQMYQRAHMLLNVKSTKDIENLRKYAKGELQYLVEEGFVPHERYHEIMKVYKDKKQSAVIDLVTGQYKSYKKRSYGPFLTDPHKKWLPDFTTVFGNLHETYMKNRAYHLKLYNLTEGTPEAHAINVAFLNDPVTQKFYNLIEFIVNKIFGIPVKLLTFGGVNIQLNIDSIVKFIFDFFSGKDISLDTLEKGGAFAVDYFTCNLPEDIDGTNLYNPWCFLFLNEFALNWITGVPNKYIKMQIPWAKEFINQNCTTVFNGRSNLFRFVPIHNCDIVDGQNRPYCDTCDYCKRTYFQCIDIANTVNDPLDSLFFMTGMVPFLIDKFYNGGLPTADFEEIMLVLAALFLLFLNPFAIFGPQILAIPFGFWAVELVVYTFDKVFNKFFSGPGGGLPYGMLFIIIFVASLYFLSFLYDAVWELGLVFGLLSASWLISLVFPFKNIDQKYDINQWMENFFYGIDQGPTPLKYLDWSGFTERANRFNFNNQPIRNIDVSCYIITIGNVGLLVVGGFTIYWGFYLFWGVITIIFIYILEVLYLLWLMIAAIRQWYRNHILLELARKDKDKDKAIETLRKIQKDHDRFLQQIQKKPEFAKLKSYLYTRGKKYIMDTYNSSFEPMGFE